MKKTEDNSPMPEKSPKKDTKAAQPLLAVLLREGTWPMYGFFKETLQGIQRVAFSHGYGLVLVNPAPHSEIDVKTLVESLKNTVQGILFVAPQTDQAVLDSLDKDNFPMVLLYRHDPNFNFVEVDNLGGAFSVVDHLCGLGHERIAYLNGPPEAPGAKSRMDGYVNALKKNKIPFYPEYVLSAEFDQSKAYTAMRQFLRLKIPPTAVFAANDYMALGAISAIRDEGLSVPGDIAVAGFDDLEMPSLTFRAPPLTTVRQPIYEIAKEGTEILIMHVESRIKDLRQKIYPSQLVVRSSCGASPKK